MRSDRYLTEADQYETVYAHGRSFADGPVLMKSVRNGLQCSRYGFSVGRRVGKAVTRNRVKRRLREVMRSKTLAPGWDIVFVARASAAESGFATLKRSIDSLLARAGLQAKGEVRTTPDVVDPS
jgi:ribonuclease P protein component